LVAVSAVLESGTNKVERKELAAVDEVTPPESDVLDLLCLIT
jgi:hypothetical protein